MLNNLDLFKLRLIEALVNTKSLKGAAQVLGITSSAVSQNVKSLEATLGHQLFMRVGKSMQPSELALAVTAKVRPFFNDLAQVLENTHERMSEIKISSPPVFGATVLLNKINQLKSKQPSLRLCISLADTHKIMDKLLRGETDIGFIDDNPDLSNTKELVVKPFFSETLVLCCSNSFAKKHLRHNKNTLRELKVLPHVPYHNGKEGIYKWYRHHFNQAPDLNWTLSIDSSIGVYNAIKNSMGLGVIPKSLLLKKDSLFVIEGPKLDLINTVFLAQNRNKVPSQVEKTFLNQLMNG